MSLFSCDRYKVYDHVIKIPRSGWNADQPVTFDLTVSDTAKKYDLLIHFRNSKSYEFNNVWFFIETVAPNGNMLRDTFEIRLADNSGRWMGKGIGDVNQMHVPYKSNFTFQGRGIYHVKIQQAMREETLENVLDIGLRLQQHNP